MKTLAHRTCVRSNRFFFQRGASLLEGIAYLGVASIVILGAVALLGSAFSSANMNRGESEITSIRTGVKKLYMGQAGGYGTGSMNATLITAKVFPSSILPSSGTTVKNAWNGNIVVTGASNTFTISYDAVPREVCVNMLGSSSDWTSVTVNNSPVTLPITPSAATSACGNSNNTIVWEST